MAILQLVDQLADLLHQGWQIPFTPFRAVRAREVAQLIERMRINVPSSIRESERTLAERDRIVADAKAEANRIVDEARARAMEIVSERALLDTARAEAQRIVDESKEIARRRAEEADQYAVQTLRALQEQLEVVARQVDNGIQVMIEGGKSGPVQRRE